VYFQGRRQQEQGIQLDQSEHVSIGHVQCLAQRERQSNLASAAHLHQERLGNHRLLDFYAQFVHDRPPSITIF